jgi:hypothetical protein
MTDICYPTGTDWSCVMSPDELEAMKADPDTLKVIERAEALAWSTLAALTGYRLSLCPVIIRPCAMRCSIPTWYVAPVDWGGVPGGGVFTPYIFNGSWYNGCGCASAGECSCTMLSQVILPTEVGRVDEVWLNGAMLADTDYRVDNGRKLTLTNGDIFPLCQDMSIQDPEEGGVWINFYPGVAPNDLFCYAAGVMANEYYKACKGSDCRLPTGVTNVTRNGLALTVEPGSFPGGMTGIAEVDAVIRTYNPFALKAKPRVMSPDVFRGRQQTWTA